MELKRYLALIWKGWWIVGLVAVIAAGTAYGISKATTPLFRATTSLKAGASLGGNGNATGYITLTQGGLLNQYAAILDSYPLVNEVDQQLQLDMPVEKLQSEIKVAPVNQSLTITVDVEDKDPNRAAAVANKLDALFLEQQQAEASRAAAVLGTQQDVILPSVLNPARVPTAPFKPRTKVNVVVGGVLGVLIGVLLVLLIEYMDDTIRSPEEAETLLDARTLAAIPRVRRGKRRPSTMSTKREEAVSTLSHP
ncbi:MAG: YveK family protein [Chloroflexota bacterium]